VAPQRKRFPWKSGVLALVSLLLCAVSLHQSWHSRTSFTSLRLGYAVLMTADGKACLLVSTQPPAGSVRQGFSSVPIDRTGARGILFQWPKFNLSSTTHQGGETTLTAVAPLWFVAILLALPPVWWIFRNGGRHTRPEFEH
jgi:hypothetical protein